MNLQRTFSVTYFDFCYRQSLNANALNGCMQLGIIDLQSLLWGFAASLTPPAVLLSPTKPTFKLCSKPIIKPILECLVGAAVLQSCCIVLMKAELHVTAGSIITTTMVRLFEPCCEKYHYSHGVSATNKLTAEQQAGVVAGYN